MVVQRSYVTVTRHEFRVRAALSLSEDNENQLRIELDEVNVVHLTNE